MKENIDIMDSVFSAINLHEVFLGIIGKATLQNIVDYMEGRITTATAKAGANYVDVFGEDCSALDNRLFLKEDWAFSLEDYKYGDSLCLLDGNYEEVGSLF